MEYKEYLQTSHWKNLRAQKKNRRCAVCATNEVLHTHHLNYGNLFNVSTSDLRVLCKRCHFLSHELFRSGILVFKNNNHHSRFALLKYAVKKHLGLTTTNLFKGTGSHYPSTLFD